MWRIEPKSGLLQVSTYMLAVMIKGWVSREKLGEWFVDELELAVVLVPMAMARS